MTFELSAADAALVHEFVEGRLVDLKKEINRTENIAFREELRKIQRALEHLLDQLTRRRAGRVRLSEGCQHVAAGLSGHIERRINVDSRGGVSPETEVT